MKQNYLGISVNVIDMIKSCGLKYEVIRSWMWDRKTYVEVDVYGTEEEIENLNEKIWG